MEMENNYGLMEIHMKVNLLIPNDMVKVKWYFKTVRFIKENLAIIKLAVKERIYGQIKVNIVVILQME
jgi:hypothetical protein